MRNEQRGEPMQRSPQHLRRHRGVDRPQHAIGDQLRHLVAEGEERLDGDGLLRRRTVEGLLFVMLERGVRHHEGELVFVGIGEREGHIAVEQPLQHGGPARALGNDLDLRIAAARVTGMNGFRIMVRHVLPNVWGPIIVNTAVLAAVILGIQGGLNYLNLGVNPPDPSWGGMVADAQKSLALQPWLLVPSGLLMFVAHAGDFIANPAFITKMSLLFCAGINAAVFHAGVFRTAEAWDSGTAVPVPAKIHAVISLLIWISVLACGRLLAYV